LATASRISLGSLRLWRQRETRRTYHFTDEEMAKHVGVKGALGGEGGFEKAKTKLEISAVMHRTQRAVDGRSFREIRAEIFDILPPEVSEPARTGVKFLQRQLVGPDARTYYPKDPTGYVTSPFRLNPKHERYRAKLEVLRARGKGPPERGDKKEGKKKKK